MAKVPVTSKELSWACSCITVWLHNFNCTRKCFWHLFSETRQQPEQFGQCFLYLCTEENRSMRPWAGPISWHTRHHCYQRRTWSQEIILSLSRALQATRLVATEKRHLLTPSIQMDVGCPEANSLAQGGSWATAWVRWLLETRVYSWCWIQPRVESRFQPMYTYILYSESSFPPRQHSWPSNITFHSKPRGQKNTLKLTRIQGS